MQVLTFGIQNVKTNPPHFPASPAGAIIFPGARSKVKDFFRDSSAVRSQSGAPARRTAAAVTMARVKTAAVGPGIGIPGAEVPPGLSTGAGSLPPQRPPWPDGKAAGQNYQIPIVDISS